MTPGEHHPSDSATDESEGYGRTGLGALLRSERRKRGLSLSQVSEMTRLRPYILEALEEEDWGQLPAPVFVKGFIRSYARALGLQEGKAVSLFPELAPTDVVPPKPLVAPTKSRWRLSVITMGLLVVLAVLYYLWGEWSERTRVGQPPESIFSEVGSADKGRGAEEATAVSPTPQESVAEPDAAGTESPGTFQNTSVQFPRRHGISLEPGRALLHRDIDMLSFSGSLPVVIGNHRAHSGICSGMKARLRHAYMYRRLITLTCLVHRTTHAHNNDIRVFIVPVRAIRPKRCN